MTGEILNRFGIYRSVYQIRDVCVPKLMRSNLEINTVHNVTIVSRLLSKNRLYRMPYSLTVDIAHIVAFLCGTNRHILPQSFELSIRQRPAFPIGYYIIRFGILLGFLQARCQLRGKRNISFGRISFEIRQNDRTVILRVPCPAYR